MYIFFMSLGCDKNLVDSEEMLGALVSHGFEVTDDESQADVIVVNTCCFIHDAKEESIQAILEMADYKTKGNLKALIVTGCLAQRYKEEITKEIPDIVLRTTLITGFPGETQEDHEELMEFVDQMEFDRLGVFTYSPEEDTPAATMEDQIPEEVKQDRQAELMELQQEISLERGESCVGKDYLVMIEGKVADENAYVGRTYADAPGIDGYMFINTGELLMSGDFVKAHVTGSLEYDLIGEIADEYTE